MQVGTKTKAIAKQKSKCRKTETVIKPGVNLLSLQENTLLVNIWGKRTRGLVDTGVTISCASLAYLKKTNLNTIKLKPADISHISGQGNENHAVLGKLEIPVVISGIQISFDFYVLEN